jgi:predicted alpha/beta-hydrolase family hydrolase
VIKHLRKTLNLPIWLIGTSRGTVSVANAATRLRENRPDGVVFSSTLFESGRWSDVFEFELETVAVPTLIVHHRKDECEYTAPAEVPAFRARLKRAQPLKVMWFEGGVPRGGPCRARHYHGFNGIEEQVIAAIAAWIKQPAP